ncbi:hypothetical protein SISNIDRAFT_550854 [Sistotremastrum niveocremeum HHB9708]|uniref:F-box domain-containing protein n=1 Tax=Sistotremastrum niveocremeum HHB9708 TaxID=1314777 RepID=A0A164SUY2_9AGAM|nr:hypothetical protein SISNIDRAFT_550854 [Sistotremastrum niveocremeum HHB9708]
MERVPVEIWHAILQEACAPLTQDLVERSVWEGVQTLESMRTHEYKPLRDDRRTKCSVILTCRAWAAISIPFLYDLIIVSARSRAKLLSELISILPRRIPFKPHSPSGDNRSTYGHLVKAVVADTFYGIIETDQMLQLMNFCPNIRWIRSLRLYQRDDPKWSSLQSAFSGQHHLQALQLYWEAEPQPALEPLFEASIPPAHLPSLKLLRTNLGSTVERAEMLSTWELPSLRHLAFIATHLMPRVNAEMLSTFLVRHGLNLESLSIACIPIYSDVLSISALCPHLTQLAVPGPWVLSALVSGDPHLLLPYHPTLRSLAFTEYRLWCLGTWREEAERGKPALEAIRRTNFPRLQNVYAESFTVYKKEDGAQEQKPRLPRWWKKILEVWKEEDIRFLMLGDESQVTLDAVSKICVWVDG